MMFSWTSAVGLLRTLGLGLVLSAAAVTTAGAANLTGKTLVAKGDQVITKSNMGKESVTWSLEIYYGNAGNRFVLFTKENAVGTTNFKQSFNRVLIPAGKDRGLKRRKDGNFTLDVRLEQSGSSLVVKLFSRGKDTGYASELFKYVIAVSDSSCTLQSYTYAPDGGLSFFRVETEPASCTVSVGAPAGIDDK